MKHLKTLLLLSVVVTISFVIYSCTKHQSPVVLLQEKPNKEKIIDNFINSGTFARTKNILLKYGKLSKTDVTLDSVVVDNKNVFHFFTIAIKKDGILSATLDVIDLHETKNLPYGDTYALNLNDITELDTKSLSGTIRLFDLNYDNFQHSEFKLYRNKIKDRIYKRPSKKLIDKFVSIKLSSKFNYRASKNITYGVKAIPCDINGNGNLGFFECYGCFKSASEVEDTFGNWWCDVPVAGWASCFATISASCAILSSIY
jgi:hypothetical protein